MSSPWFPQTWRLDIQTSSSIFISSDQRILSFRCFLANSRQAVMCPLPRSCFYLATLPYRPDRWNAAEIGGLLEASLLSTVQRWNFIRFLVTSLTEAILPDNSGKTPVSSKLFLFTDDGDHCAHWDLKCCRTVSVPQCSPVLEVCRQFLSSVLCVKGCEYLCTCYSLGFYLKKNCKNFKHIITLLLWGKL